MARQQISIRVPLVAHSSEFHQLEDLFFPGLGIDPSRAELGEKGISLHSNRSDDGQNQKDREQYDQSDQGQGKVDHSLEAFCVHSMYNLALSYSKQERIISIILSCSSAVILISLGRHNPLWKISAPLSMISLPTYASV